MFTTNNNRLLIKWQKKLHSVWTKYYCNKIRCQSSAADFVENIVETGNSGVPECPKPSFLQSFFAIFNYNKAKRLHESVDRKHQIFGPIFKEQIGDVSAIFVSSPDAYQKIFRVEGNTPKHFLPEAWLLYNQLRQCSRGLLFMDDEEWLHFRRIMNKLLLRPCDAKQVINDSCQNAAISLANNWEEYCDSSKPIPKLEKQLYKWSIEVMMATLLGSSWRNFKHKVAHEEYEKLANNLQKIFLYTAKLSLLPSKYVMKFNLPLWRNFVKTVDESMKIVYKLVPKMSEFEGDGLLNMMQNEGIEQQDLSRIVADLIIAAGDTTAHSIQWALYLLAIHPDVQQRLMSIIDSRTTDEIMREPYVKGIVKESLRLYPTAPFITRILAKDCVISGYLVAQGELICMSLYSSGRNPENFSKPNDFLPERWIRNEHGAYNGVYNAYGSIPFALGARSCVGKKLAEAQMILTICELIKRYKIECINKDRIELILHMISVPSESLQFTISRR